MKYMLPHWDSLPLKSAFFPYWVISFEYTPHIFHMNSKDDRNPILYMPPFSGEESTPGNKFVRNVWKLVIICPNYIISWYDIPKIESRDLLPNRKMSHLSHERLVWWYPCNGYLLYYADLLYLCSISNLQLLCCHSQNSSNNFLKQIGY